MHLLHPSSTAQNCDRLLDCVFYSYKASHLVTSVRIYFLCFFLSAGENHHSMSGEAAAAAPPPSSCFPS